MTKLQKYNVNGEEVTAGELVRRILAISPSLTAKQICEKVKKDFGIELKRRQVQDAILYHRKSVGKTTRNGTMQTVTIEEQDTKVDPANTQTIFGIRKLKEAIAILGKDAVKEILNLN